MYTNIKEKWILHKFLVANFLNRKKLRQPKKKNKYKSRN